MIVNKDRRDYHMTALWIMFWMISFVVGGYLPHPVWIALACRLEPACVVDYRLVSDRPRGYLL